METPVWGRAAPGSEVRVWLGDTPALTARADDAGNWKVMFKGLKTRVEPTTLIVTSAAESITLRDVVVGEVWFAGGQSNMGTQLKDTTNGGAEAVAHSDPLLRMHVVSRSPSDKPQFTTKGTSYSFGKASQWYADTEGQAAKFSATGYYFAKELRAHLGEVPVGILLCVVGGRPIQSHCAPEVLERTDLGRRQLAAYHVAVKGWDSGKAQAEYPAKLKAWEAAKQNIRLKPMKPVDPRTDFWQPASIYHGMIRPQIPFAFRGALWIQGENNTLQTEEPRYYADQLTNMIADWRSRFGHEFTCLIVQLAGFRSPSAVPQVPNPALMQHNWPLLCDQQRIAHQRIPRSGLVVAHDLGEVDNIHPRNKLDIARRLMRWAEFYDYGGKTEPSGPLFEKAEFTGSEVIVRFQHAEGLTTRDGQPPAHFDLCGSDGKLHWAKARIDDGKVMLSCPEVPQPVQVRYAWSNQPATANLTNSTGLPASAFLATKEDAEGKGEVLTDR